TSRSSLLRSQDRWVAGDCSALDFSRDAAHVGGIDLAPQVVSFLTIESLRGTRVGSDLAARGRREWLFVRSLLLDAASVCPLKLDDLLIIERDWSHRRSRGPPGALHVPERVDGLDIRQHRIIVGRRWRRGRPLQGPAVPGVAGQVARADADI